ncbi:MAG: VOC family protein, partial [Pirellulaceae bacterium]|nr:VOC family protein [Pirellulaceae bacterium]
MSDVKPIPDRFNSLSAYLIVSNSVEAIEFYTKAFGAELVSRMPGPDGNSTMHAELAIGDSMLMLSDE